MIQSIIYSLTTIDSNADTIVSDSLNVLTTQTPVSVNPWMLMIVGMTTVFVGLVIINITINVLKKLTHGKIKKETIEDEKEESKIIEALRKNVKLSEDEITALSLGIAIEYELYYSDEEQLMTFNYPDREPGWINTRRQNG